MGKKIANEDDPILQRLNGAQQPSTVEVQSAPEEDDPILQKLNQVKKKEPTVSAPESKDGSTVAKAEGSIGPLSKVSKPLEKSTPKQDDGFLGTIRGAFGEMKKSYETPQEIQKSTPIVNAYKRGLNLGNMAEIISPFSKARPDDEKLKEVARLQKETQELPASDAYNKFNNSESVVDALSSLAENPIQIISELTVESLASLGNYGASRVAVGAGIGAGVGSVVPGIGTAVGAGSGIIAGLADTSLALEYSGSFVESLQKAGVDVTDTEQLKKAFEDDLIISEARTHALKKGIPIAIFDLISGGVAGRIVAKPAKSLVTKTAKMGAEFGTQAVLGGAGEAAGQAVSGEDLKASSIIAEMIGELGTTPVEVSANLLGRVKSKVDAGKTTQEIIKEETREIDPNNLKALDQSAAAIQAKVDASEQEVITPEQKPITNETIQAQTQEAGVPGTPTGELPETSTAQDTQAEATKTDFKEDHELELKSLIDNPNTIIKAATFVSPNEEENLTFDQASTNLSTPQQKIFNLTSKILAQEVGIKSIVEDAIGDWSDGAENSVVEEITEDVDFETVQYVASVRGKMANQKSVIPFIADNNGNDAVHQVTVNDTIENVRKKLDKLGVQFRTLVKNSDGIKVIIFDPEFENSEKVEQFADSYGTKEQTTRGTGEFIGSETREGAIERYQEVIDSFEDKKGRRKGLAAQIQSLYRDNLTKINSTAVDYTGEVVPYTPDKSLSPEHKKIETKFAKYLNQNFEEAKNIYTKRFGNVLSADNARELSEDYMADRSLSSVIHEPSTGFIKKLYQDKLSAEWFLKGNENRGVFTSGGTGAGKTVSLNGESQNNFRFIYDGNLDHFESSKEKIDKALNADVKEVNVMYIYREPIDAFENGVIKGMLNDKSGRHGRTIPLYVHAQTHIGARENIEKLMKEYRGNENVSFTVIDNSRGKGNQRVVPIGKIPKISYTAKELEEKLQGITEKLYNDGKITKSQYKGLTFKGKPDAEGARATASGSTEKVPESQKSDQRVNQGNEQPNAGKPAESVSEGLTQKVFAYGTLRSPTIRKEVFGEPVKTTPAQTTGLVKDSGDGFTSLEVGEGSVPGDVMELTPEQIKKLDKYEEKYNREEITLDNGEKAFAYKLKEPVAKKPAPQERKFATQVLEDPNVSKEVKQGLSEDAKTYIPKGIRITDQEAKAIIEVKGPEAAMADFLDRSNEIPEDTRAVLGQNLIRYFNQAQDFDNAVKIADNLAKWYTDLGRAVNAGKVFQMLTPEGVLRYVSKEITKAKADYSRKTTGKRRQSKDAVDYINKQAVEKVLKNPKIKNRITSEVKKGRIKQAIDFLETLKIDTKGKALDVTYGLTAGAWNTLITAVQKGLQAGLTLSQAINKAMAKTKKEATAFDEAGAGAFLSDKLKDYRVTLDPELAIKEELRAQNDKIDNIIREHYTVVDEKKRSLVDKLVKDANLDEATAKVVAQDLSKEFDRLTREAKEKALRKYLPKEKKTNKAAKKDLIDSIIEASNVGALSDEQYKETISEKIGVKSLTPEEAKKITGLADKVQRAKEGFDKSRATQALLDYISHIDGYSALDVAMSIWYANILSGLSTQVLNISANFTETIGEAYLTAVHNPKEFGWIFKGLFTGWGRGFLEAMDTMQHGFQPTKFEQKISTSPVLERVKFKGGPWNPYNYLKYVSRLMNAADIFFYQGINEMRSRELAVKTAKKDGKYKADRSAIKRAKELIYKGEKPWSEAMESAKAEGWSGRDLKRRAYEILEQQRPEFLIKDSNDAAARGTFNYDPEGTLGALTSLVNLASEKVNIGGLKPIKFIVPFTRIISNVANRYLDWTPVGLLRAAKGGIGFKSLGENLHREYTPEERAKVLTKAMTGIIGFTALYALTDEDDGPFEITADGTGDVFKNYELQETGWRPYSIKINGTWYEYKNTPLAIPMATLGYLRDLMKYRGEKDIEAKVSIMLFGTMKYIMDLSFLQSLSSFFDTFSKDNTSSADSFFKKSVKRTESTAKSFVIPNAFTQVSRSMQEVMDLPIKRANSFGDQVIRDLPILRDRLGNIYDALGDPVVPNQTERFLPLKPSKSTEEKDKLWTLIADNGAWIGRPGRGTLKPNGEGLTDSEYDEFSLLAGKLTKQKLLLNYYFLSQLKDKQEIKEEIGNLKREARREARDTLFGFEIF